MFRRDPACDTSRSGMSSIAVTARANERRIGAQVLADDADDRHVGSVVTSANVRRLRQDVVEPPRRCRP